MGRVHMILYSGKPTPPRACRNAPFPPAHHSYKKQSLPCSLILYVAGPILWGWWGPPPPGLCIYAPPLPSSYLEGVEERMMAPAGGTTALAYCYGALEEVVTWGLLQVVNATAGVELRSAAPTRGLPAVDSPAPMFLALSAYLCAVCGGLLWIRVAGLRPRPTESWPLGILVFLHNWFCLGLSVYMCLGILTQAFRLKYSVWGNAYDEDETELAFFIYLFYISKIFELMDTIIMLLKRNVHQITVLHVYHHVSITVIWWIIAHHAPGGDAYFSAAMNSAVHVIMYFYYLLSSILRSKENLRRKYLFWGKHLTQVQMLQFGVNMVQAYYCIKVQAPYPRFLCKILFYYMISLLLLFSNFYMHKYSKASAAKQSKLE